MQEMLKMTARKHKNRHQGKFYIPVTKLNIEIGKEPEYGATRGSVENQVWSLGNTSQVAPASPTARSKTRSMLSRRSSIVSNSYRNTKAPCSTATSARQAAELLASSLQQRPLCGQKPEPKGIPT